MLLYHIQDLKANPFTKKTKETPRKIVLPNLETREECIYEIVADALPAYLLYINIMARPIR